MKHDEFLKYDLIKTNRRLTFDISWQREDTRYRGPDDGDYFLFTASNGYQVISRSRMDIQTERLWLIGAKENERSGSMVFSSNEMRDRAYNGFMLALDEWCDCVRSGRFGPMSAQTGYRTAQFLGNGNDPSVDACPRPYRSIWIDGVAHLQRVLDCEAEFDFCWKFGQAQPVTDFARISPPISVSQVQAMKCLVEAE